VNAVDVCVAEGAHEAAKADPVRWQELPHIGEQSDGCGGIYELRNCDRCRSTLAIPMGGQS